MGLRQILKPIIPDPIRHLGWRGYYYACDNWLKPPLKTIVGCRTSRKIVALTFDDGPHPDATPAILDVLARYQVKATFFLLGRSVAAFPEVARKVTEAGHAVGNHTFHHPFIPDLSPGEVAGELSKCQKIIRETMGISPDIMRPPFGAQSPESFITARFLGYEVVHWSAEGDDWKGDPAPLLAQRILSQLHPGGIILLHDGWEPPPHQPEHQPEYKLFQDRRPTIEALPMIIEPLLEQGYQFVTMPAMIQMGSLVRESWFK